jgi:hypothetical protein
MDEVTRLQIAHAEFERRREVLEKSVLHLEREASVWAARNEEICRGIYYLDELIAHVRAVPLPSFPSMTHVALPESAVENPGSSSSRSLRNDEMNDTGDRTASLEFSVDSNKKRMVAASLSSIAYLADDKSNNNDQDDRVILVAESPIARSLGERTIRADSQGEATTIEESLQRNWDSASPAITNSKAEEGLAIPHFPLPPLSPIEREHPGEYEAKSAEFRLASQSAAPATSNNVEEEEDEGEQRAALLGFAIQTSLPYSDSMFDEIERDHAAVEVRANADAPAHETTSATDEDLTQDIDVLAVAKARILPPTIAASSSRPQGRKAKAANKNHAATEDQQSDRPGDNDSEVSHSPRKKRRKEVVETSEKDGKENGRQRKLTDMLPSRGGPFLAPSAIPSASTAAAFPSGAVLVHAVDSFFSDDVEDESSSPLLAAGGGATTTTAFTNIGVKKNVVGRSRPSPKPSRKVVPKRFADAADDDDDDDDFAEDAFL